MKDIPVCVAPTGDRCGEGPVWHPAEQAVYWTDINRFLIHRYDPVHRTVKSWFFDEPAIGVVLTDRVDTLAVILGSRIILWEPADDRRQEHGFRLRGWPAVRLNDGRADARGSLWVGSMRNNLGIDGSPTEAGGSDGILFRIDPNGAVSEWRRGIGISNTLAWSPDNARFYFADTLANEIYGYEYDETTGAISMERPFLTGFARGLPDGSSVDREGCLWNCRFFGSCIVRIAPHGRVDRIIEFPTTNITSCTFGGSDYKTLYVTTASSGAPPGERLAGGLFAVDLGIPGRREHVFQITR